MSLQALVLMLLCVMVMVSASVYVAVANRIGVPVTEMYNVRVIEPVGSFSYWLLDDHGQRIYATFCDTLGYEPPFDSGETIQVLKFRNIGTCWDMRNMHPKYVMKRDANGDVIREE